MKIHSLLPVAIAILLGCGGGGGGSNGGTTGGTTQEPQLRGDFIGVYTGTLTVGANPANVTAYISDSSASLIQTDGSVHPVAVGTFSKTVNGLSGNLLLYPYGSGYGIDDSQAVSFITTVAGNSLIGTFTTSAGNGSINLKPAAIPANYHIALTDLEGTWSNGTTTLKIDSTGKVISGTGGFGGAITGSLSLFPTANQPFVGVNLTVGVVLNMADGTKQTQSFPITGMAYMTNYTGSLSSHTSFNQLQIMALGKQVPYDTWVPRMVCMNDILYKE